MKKMKVIIGCERSGIIRDAFIRKGHDAISCDLEPTDVPGPHHQGDILELLENEYFDLGIIHPPCTFIANSSIQWLSHPDDKYLPFEERRPNPFYPTRREDQKKAIIFFKKLLFMYPQKIGKLCLENPIPYGALTKDVGMYSQIVEPYYFGDSFNKPTCLWLKNLPKLIYIKQDDLFYKKTVVDEGEYKVLSSGKRIPKWYSDAKVGNKDKTQRVRSKTFPGMAQAMADQWG